MDSKLEYITRLFKKISSKGIETYVITRIWHLLNDDRIKLIPQQYVRHDDGQYSLTDIYFPQFNIHVEVNEPGHYRSDIKIASDALRENNIVIASGHQIRTIDCNRSMNEIHLQVEVLILEIRSAQAALISSGHFKPWQPDVEYKAVFYQYYQKLRLVDNVALETIEQICELFQVKVPRMGYMRKGAVAYPPMQNTIIWWPGTYNAKWDNRISPDGCTIIEKALKEKVPGRHAAGVINNPHQRITFYRDTDKLGYTYYRFKGVFSLDATRSNTNDGLYWIKTEDHVNLSSSENSVLLSDDFPIL